jgi:outer membrane protein
MSFSMVRPLAVCSALFALAQFAPAQTKVGVVNLQQAVFQSAEIKRADAAMQAKYQPRQTELDKLNADVSGLAQKLQAGQGKLTVQQESDLTSQGQRLQREVQRKTEDLQADVERERNETLTQSSQKMGEIVKKVAEAKGLDLVVDTSTAIYFKEAMDITKDVIAAYDQAHPAAAAPAAKPPAK